LFIQVGVILAALSFGYWLGGKLSNKQPSFFKLSLFIFFAGLHLLVLGLFQFKFLYAIMKLNNPLILSSLIISLILFTLPSVLLGMVSPYIIQLVLNQRNISEGNAGTIIGKFYAISTIGSILGTFLCGFYLIIKFGIDTIFLFLSFVLFLSALMSFILDKTVKKNY